MLEAWCDSAKDREGFRDQVRRKTNLPAKTLLLQVAHGGSAPSVADEDLTDWLAKSSKSARCLWWLPAFQFPDLPFIFHVRLLFGIPWKSG